MARETVTKDTCDRCGKLYSESTAASSPAAFDKRPPTLHLEHTQSDADTGKDVRKTVSFNDLCPKCQNRVKDLVSQIQLAPESDAKPENDTKPLDGGAKAPDNKGKPTEAKAPSDAKVTNSQGA
jgi:DNA-directed RNA polymerase subunit M/transcription elongation factor TFIIS